MDQVEPAYFEPNISSMINEWSDGEPHGEKSFVSELDSIFAWMRGDQCAWYGWPNDGKGTFFDFMALMKAKFNGDNFMMFKPEDMSSSKINGQTIITANDIYKNLAWMYTGQTPYKHFAAKYHQKQIPFDQYQEAIEFVRDHFRVIFTRQREYKNIIDLFKFYRDKYNIQHFLIDPAKSIKLEKGERDQIMNDMFIEGKQFSLETNSSLHWIAHPKSMADVRVSKKEDSAYKVVNQYMIAGGAAWDNNMDAQYSIYRPERHLNPSDPKVHFINLKQRKAELVGVQRGSYELIKFDFLKKRYYFNGVCPLDASIDHKSKKDDKNFVNLFDSGEPTNHSTITTDPDEAPF